MKRRRARLLAVASLVIAIAWLACGRGGETSPAAAGGSTSTASNTTGGGQEQAGGGATDAKLLSESCNSDAQCETGHCVDGLCCESACTGLCRSCAKAHTGLPNGRCGGTMLGVDPDGECFGGVCRGDGDCCGDRPTPPAGGCPAACTGGCEGGVCRISCATLDACRDQQIDCPPDFDCELICSGQRGCRKTELFCQPDYLCSVTCADVSESCRELVVHCDSGMCELGCDGQDRCENAEVHCGPNSCQLSCSGTQNNLVVDDSASCDFVSDCVST